MSLRRIVMAGSRLCVACSSLPIKDRDVAVRVRRCPECRTEVGVTSYGTQFRAAPAERRRVLGRPALVAGFAGAAVVSALAGFLAVAALYQHRHAPQPIAEVKPVEQNQPIAAIEEAVEEIRV